MIFRIAIIILIVETLIMLILASINVELSAIEETLIDSFILVMLSAPLIYLWVMLPYKVEREKELNYLFQTSRMAQMGEMISMIAHQWRQPLNSLGLIVQKINLMYQKNKLSDELMEQSTEKAMDTINHMSETIDDFRNFYSTNNQALSTSLEVPLSKALNIIRDSLNTDNIVINENYKSKNKLNIYEDEFMHVILNILKNAQDNFKEKNVENPQINIKIQDEYNNTVLQVCDNGGGIDDDIINHIFDPYFSTKGEKNGTGLGLYISKMIIETHHMGQFSVENKNEGACFIIRMKKTSL